VKGSTDVWVVFDEKNAPVEVDRAKPEVPQGYKAVRYSRSAIVILRRKRAKK
jgi:hypothetical protein